MPTREEMIAELRAQQEQPSREEMIAQIRAAQQAPQKEEEPGVGSQVLDYGLKALDYAGGIGRTAAAGYADLANLVLDRPAINKPDALMSALKGEAPTTAEFLERSGAEPGLGTEAIGFAGDVLLDPTTYLTGGVSAAGKATKLQKLLKPGKTALEATGDKLRKSGVKNIDQALEEKNIGKLSTLLKKEDITGTTKGIQKKLGKLSEKFKAERAAMYKEASEKGAKVNTQDILDAFQKDMKKMIGKTDTPAARETAEKLYKELSNNIPRAKNGKFKAQLDLQQASNIKTKLRDDLPDSFYNKQGKVKKDYQKGINKISKLFQENIEKSANKAKAGLGDDIAKKNKDWSVVIGSEKPLAKEVKKAEAKNWLTAVDAMILGGGSIAGSSPEGTAGALLLKKAADAAKTTGARTKSGRLMEALSKIPALDSAGRRAIINATKEDQE